MTKIILVLKGITLNSNIKTAFGFCFFFFFFQNVACIGRI